MLNGTVQFFAGHWLALIPLLFAYLGWWFSKHNPSNNLKFSPCIADIDLSAHNHYYHPLAHKLIAQSKTKIEKNSRQYFWLKPYFWWQSIAINLLIIALAQPVLIGERLPDPPPERDIVFLVDTSVSMQLMDYELAGKAIRRMDLLHNLLDEFAKKMDGERIAVIIFGEQSHMLIPLSNDQGLIRRMLSRVTTTLAGRYSAMGEALLMALREAKKTPDRHQTIILFTDADASRGKVTPAAAAELLAEHHIPVFTIAIGSSQRDKTDDIRGGLYQPVNLPLLADIAQRTKGASFQVNDSEAMQQALQDILKQRQNLSIPEPQYERKDLYRYPLFTALLMLIMFQIWRLFSEQHLIGNLGIGITINKNNTQKKSNKSHNKDSQKVAQ